MKSPIEELQMEEPTEGKFAVDIPLKSVREAEFLESSVDLVGVTLRVSKAQGSPCLKVTAASEKIKEAVDAVSIHVNAITTEKHMYANAGESKVLEKNQEALKTKAERLQCKLYLSPQATWKHSFYIKGSLTLTIFQGCISQFASDALVCPLSTMAFDNPIAKEFLQFGGPEIKNVFEKCIDEKQSLMSGEVVMSNPGTLRAKELIYAVIGTSPLNSKYLQAVVHKSLLEADNRKCVSIGMPMLGCGTFGFPVKQSCEDVIAGILGFIGGHQTSTQHLKNIYLLESDVKVVEEFQSAIEDMLSWLPIEDLVSWVLHLSHLQYQVGIDMMQLDVS